MKVFKNIEDLEGWFEFNNYYYRGQQFENQTDAQKEAENRFDYDEIDVSLNRVKCSKYYIDEIQNVVELVQYEAHGGDSGVPTEDYFYAYIISK